MNRERERLGLSATDVAAAVGLKTRQHIHGIETGKRPSLEVLAKLVRRLSRSSAVEETLKKETILRFALAAFNISASEVASGPDPTRLQEEGSFQESLTKGSAVWILTDTFGELLNADLLKKTISNIQEGEVSYTYFVPHGSIEWEGLVAAFEQAIDGRALRERLRIISVTALAFACRLRIAHPGSARQQAVYSLHVEESEYLFYPAPPDLIRTWVKSLTPIVASLSPSIDERRSQEHVSRALGARLGDVRLLFPRN